MNSTTKRIAASAVSALIAMSMIQTATAGERARKHVTTSEQVRNANAAVAIDQDEIGRYRNGAGSAPAGH